MPSSFPFSAMQRSLLELAADRATAAFKAAKNAAKKAFLTEAESEAHTMEGYAAEAKRFLANGTNIANESAEADATEEEKAQIVELVFNHRAALRVGCLIMIKEMENNVSEQSEFFVSPEAMEARLRDVRKLENKLRTMNSDQAEFDIEDDPPATETSSPVSVADDEASDTHEIFDDDLYAAPMREPLALGAGAIEEADFEVLSDDDLVELGVAQDDPSADAEPEDEHEEDAELVGQSAEAGDPNDPTSDAWLAEPLREDPKLDPRD